MEPIPETAAFFDDFGKYYDADLLDELKSNAEAVRALVPDLVGLSVAAMEDGVAFTLVASDGEVAMLDALQYVVGGPCVEAPKAEAVQEFGADPSRDEDRWQKFAKATAAKAVGTTLTLPILDDGSVVGTVNLYAASGRAFVGLHEELARIFDAWAPGAIANADLSFQTRRIAEDSAAALRTTMRVEMAVGVLMAEESVDSEGARVLLVQAAHRAGVNPEELAETLLEVYDSQDES